MPAIPFSLQLPQPLIRTADTVYDTCRKPPFGHGHGHENGPRMDKIPVAPSVMVEQNKTRSIRYCNPISRSPTRVGRDDSCVSPRCGSRRLHALEAQAEAAALEKEASPRGMRDDDGIQGLSTKARNSCQVLSGITSSRARRRILRSYFRESDEWLEAARGRQTVDPAARALLMASLSRSRLGKCNSLGGGLGGKVNGDGDGNEDGDDDTAKSCLDPGLTLSCLGTALGVGVRGEIAVAGKRYVHNTDMEVAPEVRMTHEEKHPGRSFELEPLPPITPAESVSTEETIVSCCGHGASKPGRDSEGAMGKIENKTHSVHGKAGEAPGCIGIDREHASNRHRREVGAEKAGCSRQVVREATDTDSGADDTSKSETDSTGVGAHHRSYATSISLQEPPTRAATDDTLETEGLLACNPPEKLDPSPSGSRSYKPNTRSASKDESQVHAHGQAGTEAKAEIVTEVLPNWGGDSENHSVKLEGETRMAQDTDDSKIRLECSGGLTHQTTQRRLPPEEAENACCRTGLTDDGKAVVEPFNAIGACSLSPTVFSCRESGLDTGRCHAKVDRRTGIRATAEDGAAAEFVQGIPKPKSKPRPEPMEPSVSSFGGEGGASAGVSQEVPEMETTDHLASKYCDRRLKYDTQSKEWAREYNEYLRSSDQGSAVSLSTRPEVLTGGEAWKEGDATGQGPLIAQKPCGDWAREYHEYLCQKEDEVEASRRACATSPTADSTPGYPL